MHRLEDPGRVRAWSEARARRHAHPALQLRRDVCEHVTEEVRRDDDVEAERIPDHPCRQRVDEYTLDRHVRVLGGEFLDDLIPENVAVARRIRLRCARESSAPALGQLERVPDDAPYTFAREDGSLDPDLMRMAGVCAATHARVLALGVLAHEEHVDRRRARERGGDPVEEACRPQVRPEIEPLAERQQQPPQGHVIRHARVADGAEEHGVVCAHDLERVGRHHRPGFVEVGRAPRQFVPLELESERIDGPACLRDDFRADSVSRDHGDAMRHRTSVQPISSTPRSSAFTISRLTAFALPCPYGLVVVPDERVPAGSLRGA